MTEEIPEIVCEFCGVDESNFKKLTSKGNKFTVESAYMCMNCGLVFLHPQISDDEYYLSNEFSNDFRGTPEPTPEKRKSNRANAEPRWEIAKMFLPESGNLLEIGCSSGEFLALAEERLGVWGVDPSTGFAAAQASKTARVTSGAFPEESWQDEIDEFDVIAAFHVLEHVTSPVSFLRHIYDRLCDNGILVLEYPDLNQAVTRRNFLHIDYFQKAHLYDFSSFNLIPMLSEIGFAVEQQAVYEEYPRDKNVLLICRKSHPGEAQFEPQLAQGLWDETSKRLSEVRVAAFREHRPLKIVHIASHHINMGDGAITAGIHSVIGDLIPNKIEYTNVDIVDYSYFGQAFSAESLDDMGADLILVGGGGTIDGHKMRGQSGTAFSMSVDEIAKLNTPIGFVGLGHNLFYGQEFFHADKLQELIQYCADTNTPFSVRLDGSWERMCELMSLELAQTIDRVPDPGFFVSAAGGVSPCFAPTDKKHVVLQIALDAYSHRFRNIAGDSTEEKAEEFLATFAKYIEFLVKEVGADVTLATHTTDDIPAATVLLNHFPGDMVVRRMNMRTTGVHHPLYAPEFFRTYAQADLVVGMRGHSVICGAGLHTPTIAISTHNKVEGFCLEAGLEPWCIKPEDGDLYESLESATESLLADPEYQLAQVEMATKQWRVQLAQFMSRCLEQIK